MAPVALELVVWCALSSFNDYIHMAKFPPPVLLTLTDGPRSRILYLYAVRATNLLLSEQSQVRNARFLSVQSNISQLQNLGAYCRIY